MSKQTPNVYYGVWSGDDIKYFGPFSSEEEAEDATWEESLASGYDGAASEVITEEEYRKRMESE